VKFRHQWLSRPCAENQSVVVDHIPPHLRSNHAMYSFFDSLFPGQVASVSIILDVKGLDTLINLRDKTAAKLDYALATFARSNYKKRPTFVYRNFRSCCWPFSSGNSHSNEDEEDDLLDDLPTSPLMPQPDSDNDTRRKKSSSKVQMKKLTSSLPANGTRVDTIDYYENLLEQYNEIVAVKQRELIAWHAWHEQTEYRNAVDREEEGREVGRGYDEVSFSEGMSFSQFMQQDTNVTSNNKNVSTYNNNNLSPSSRTSSPMNSPDYNESKSNTLHDKKTVTYSGDSPSIISSENGMIDDDNVSPTYQRKTIAGETVDIENRQSVNASQIHLMNRAQPKYIRQASSFICHDTTTTTVTTDRHSVSVCVDGNSRITNKQSLYASFNGVVGSNSEGNLMQSKTRSRSSDNADLESSEPAKSKNSTTTTAHTVTSPTEKKKTEKTNNSLFDDEEMSQLYSSIRKIVKNEKKRHSCCCCMKRKPENKFKKMPFEGENFEEGEKERRKAKNIRWLAKSVVNNTIDAIVGNPVSSTGFVTFATFTATVVASRSRLYPNPLMMMTSMAPNRNEIIWENLEGTIRRKILKTVLSVAFLVTVTVFFFLPTVTIAGFLSVESLKEHIPQLADYSELHPWIDEGLAFLAPGVIMILTIVMPSIFGLMATKVFRDTRTITDTHKLIFHRYFTLLFYNVLIIITISSTLITSLTDLLNDPKTVFDKIGDNFPRISNFYLNYVCIKWGAGLAMELTRFMAFFQAGFKAILSDDYTKQQREKMMAGCRSITRTGGFYFGRFLAEHCFVFTLVMVFGVISPLILIFGFLFMLTAIPVYKRQLLYCYEPELNAGGTFWPQCFRRLIIGIISGQCAIFCMIFLLEGIQQLPFLLPLPFCTILYSRYTQRVFGSSAETVPLNTARFLDNFVLDSDGLERVNQNSFATNGNGAVGVRAQVGEKSTNDSDENFLGERIDTLQDAYTQPSLVAKQEPVGSRGDGGYSGKPDPVCCCCFGQKRGAGDEGSRHGANREELDESYVLMSIGGPSSAVNSPNNVYVPAKRRSTRGLSYGRKNSAIV